MSGAEHDVRLRSARNRVIDLLADESGPVLGDTYPLSDLNVVADQLKVAYGGTAKIPIEEAQSGVAYQLCNPRGEPLGDAFRREGGDATLVIESPPVVADVSYRIRVQKLNAPAGLAPQPPRFLDEIAPVKVGLDTSLPVEILNVPLLDSGIAAPQPSDARLVPYGTAVDVQVSKSQEGVQYSLVIDGADLATPSVRGDLHEQVLRTPPLYEDALIQVRAAKTLPGSGTGSNTVQRDTLNAKLYLKVMANPAPAVSVSPQVVDFGGSVTVTVKATQKSAQYRVFMGAIPDAAFVRAAAPGRSLLPTGAPGGLQVRGPDTLGTPAMPEGYAPVADAVQGGGDLTLTIVSPMREDSVVVVQAIKQHRVRQEDPASPTIATTMTLSQAGTALVRPDPARPIKARLVGSSQAGASLQVSDGEPGVFYYFTPAGGTEYRLPVYFHKHDRADQAQNKGIGQIAVEVDLVVANAPAVAVAQPALAFPDPPIVDTPPLAAGTALSVRAVKAQTGLEAKMAKTVAVEAAPAPQG